MFCDDRKWIRTSGASRASKYVAGIERLPRCHESGAEEMTKPVNRVPLWAILVVAAFEAVAIGAALVSR